MKDPTYKRCKCRDDDDRELGARCPKLHRSDGSWNPRHGTWYYVLELPRGQGGKRKPQLRRGGFGSQADALVAWERARDKLRLGVDPSARLTVGQYLAGWFAERRDLKPKTQRNYSQIIATYLDPLLGHISLDNFRSHHVAEMIATIEHWNDELAAGRPVRKYQRHVGPAAMQRIRACLRAALNDAPDGLIAYNPAAKVSMTPEKRQKPVVWTAGRAEAFWTEYQARLDAAKEAADGKHVNAFDVWRRMDLRPAPVMVWLPQDTGAFLDYATRHRLSALFEVVAATGMRRGEICGLPWTDVDLVGQELTVMVSRVQVGWQPQEGEPKSDASKRTIALDAATVAALRAHRKRQVADRLAWADAWVESGKVFTAEDGSALHPASVTLLFERLSFAAHLPPIRLHDMRHGAATYGLAAGLDVKLMQERLGHSTSALTRDVYTSVLPEVARAAAETAAAMIPRRRAR